MVQFLFFLTKCYNKNRIGRRVMERKEFSIARFLSSKSRFDNIVLLEGFIVGILAGVVAVIYRLMLSYGEKIAYFVVDYIKNNTTMPTTGWVTADNVDTQSQVLEGMFAYDTNALLNDSYTVHPVDCLLNTQLSDGSFPSGYNAEYTTAEVAKTLGTYKNGSVIIKAKKAYDKMMNPEQTFFNKVKLEEKETMDRDGYDSRLLAAIQPAGGIRFHSAYIRTGSNYGAILTIYDWKNELDSHWLSPLVNQNNLIVSADFGIADTREVKRMIDRSFTEQKIRFQTEHKDGEQMDAGRRYQELKELRDAVANQGETLRFVTIRLYVSAKKLDELEERVTKIQSAVETAEYHCTVLLHEQKQEWQALLLPYKRQQKLSNARDGQILPGSAISDGNPFNFSYLSDPYSCYMGSTPTMGSFNFNLFTKTKKRLSYNALVYGAMGSGKSTLLKKLIEVQALFGDYVRILDPSGEYQPLVEALGGKYLSLDGRDGILNEFEIQKTDENEGTCWVQHVSKLTAIYRLRRQNQCGQNELNTYSKLLLDFYISFGIIPKDGKITQQTPVCGLPSEYYPTMSDFLSYLNRRIQEYEPSADAEHGELGKKFLLQADEIRSTYENLVRNYGSLLDGHTSIQNISQIQVLCFNVYTVLKLEPAICSGILYNALMMYWDHCVRVGSRMKALYEKREIAERDVIHSMVVVDESHHILNAQFVDCVRQMTVMAREMRKYFSGIIFATQLITDNLKGDNASSEEKAVQDLFDLATYRFIGKQTATCIPVLESKFPGMYTETELYRIPSLDMGSFMVTAGDQNLEVKFFITETEDRLFAGGR